ncbi:MAG TPA: helix-turn-helix domain-containing protein [Thermoanaerobaculia bacterium]|nr:helix-turn-helix domain-containing protein [Thermoanaerobaculia bacterium]
MTGNVGGRRSTRQPPWEKEAVPTETGSFGEWLRRQRELREISLRDIAERTKISLRYLEAMEADRFDLLPAPIFAKGFLREYARYVGLSPDEVINHYLAVQQPEQQDEKEDTLIRRSRPKPVDPGQPPVRRTWSYGLVLTLAGLILLALVALAAWLADKRQDEPRVEQSAPPIAAPPTPAVLEPAPPPPVEEPRAPLEVTLDFTRDCWVEAVIDGRNRFSELRVQGESLQLEAETSIVLTLGNAGAVEVQVNGHALPLTAGEGEVVRDLLIDLETVRALKEKKESR